MAIKTLAIELGARRYEIVIGAGLLDRQDQYAAWLTGEQVLIITNEVVAPLYLAAVEAAVVGKVVHTLILPDGEVTKSWATLQQIFDQMVAIPLDRTATVIALGGGVIGDLAGFAAACYQRGIAFIQVPTTLLAQVDSSVGGKTAINHPRGKNMIGAFYQPRRVITDTTTLRTLDARQFRAGVAEVIKYGLINDRDFFLWLEHHLDAVLAMEPTALTHVIATACANKARLVEQDETEHGVRALLNFGHTFGHAIETATAYRTWLHGEAVALGMLMAARVSELQGELSVAAVARIAKLLQRAGLPYQPDSTLVAAELRAHMQRDKKVQAGQIRLVLLRAIGEAVLIEAYSPEALATTLAEFATGD